MNAVAMAAKSPNHGPSSGQLRADSLRCCIQVRRSIQRQHKDNKMKMGGAAVESKGKYGYRMPCVQLYVGS